MSAIRSRRNSTDLTKSAAAYRTLAAKHFPPPRSCFSLLFAPVFYTLAISTSVSSLALFSILVASALAVSKEVSTCTPVSMAFRRIINPLVGNIDNQINLMPQNQVEDIGRFLFNLADTDSLYPCVI